MPQPIFENQTKLSLGHRRRSQHVCRWLLCFLIATTSIGTLGGCLNDEEMIDRHEKRLDSEEE